MRARFYFKIPPVFPIKNRLIILSILKDAIRSQSEEFYQSFFIDGKQKTKPYTFSTYFHNLEIKNKEIYADHLAVTVSSSSVQFILFLINGCQETKKFIYKDMLIVLERVELLKEKPIMESQVWMKTLSAILIESKEGEPLLAEHRDFEKELNFIMSKTVQEIEGRSLYQPIKILKSNLRKMVIKENFHQKEGRDLYFTANQGQFLLAGDPRDLTFCYINGIGLRTGVGFGTLEAL